MENRTFVAILPKSCAFVFFRISIDDNVSVCTPCPIVKWSASRPSSARTSWLSLQIISQYVQCAYWMAGNGIHCHCEWCGLFQSNMLGATFSAIMTIKRRLGYICAKKERKKEKEEENKTEISPRHRKTWLNAIVCFPTESKKDAQQIWKAKILGS